MAWWQVSIIRSNRAEHLGVVAAADKHEALNRAISTFRVRPESRRRLVVTKIDERDDG